MLVASTLALPASFVSVAVPAFVIALLIAVLTVSPETRFWSPAATWPSFFAETVYVLLPVAESTSSATEIRSPAATLTASFDRFLITVRPSFVMLDRFFNFVMSPAFLVMFVVFVLMPSVFVLTCASSFDRFSAVVWEPFTYVPSVVGRSSSWIALSVTNISFGVAISPVPSAAPQAFSFAVMSSADAVLPSAPFRFLPMLDALTLAFMPSSFFSCATLTASVSFVPAATPLSWRVTVPSAVPMDTAPVVAFQTWEVLSAD